MMQPFFSICLATYNTPAADLMDCLRSIAVQMCRDYEVIVVDDGSERPICAEAFDELDLPFLKIVRIDNSGPYAARRVAFGAARGEVVVCVDADDSFSGNHTLDTIKQVFNDADPDVVLFNATRDGTSRFLDFSALEVQGAYLDVRSVKRAFATDFCLNSLWSKAFKRTLLVLESTDHEKPRLLMAEDRLQSLEIITSAKTFALVDEPLYCYKENLGSTMNGAYKPDYFFQICYVEDHVRQSLEDFGVCLDDWALFFLKQASGALKGICCNRSLSKSQRRGLFERMNNEDSLSEAFRCGNFEALPLSARVRLGLLRKRRYALLDACMLPRVAGSLLKQALNNVFRKTGETK